MRYCAMASFSGCWRIVYGLQYQQCLQYKYLLSSLNIVIHMISVHDAPHQSTITMDATIIHLTHALFFMKKLVICPFCGTDGLVLVFLPFDAGEAAGGRCLPLEPAVDVGLPVAAS